MAKLWGGQGRVVIVWHFESGVYKNVTATGLIGRKAPTLHGYASRLRYPQTAFGTWSDTTHILSSWINLVARTRLLSSVLQR